MLQLDPCTCPRASEISGGLFPGHLIFAHSWMLLTILTKVEPILMKYHFDKGGKRASGQLSGVALLKEPHHLRYFCQESAFVMGLLENLNLHLQSKVGVLLRHLESPSLTFLLPCAQGHSTGQRPAQGVQGAFLTGHQHCIQQASSPTSWAQTLLHSDFRRVNPLTLTLRISTKTMQRFTYKVVSSLY